MTDVQQLKFLPVNYMLHFPQTIFATIGRFVYRITYRFNAEEGFLVFRMVREKDNAVLFHGKVVPFYGHVITDPEHGELYFLLWPFSTDEDDIEIAIWHYFMPIATVT